MYFIPKLGERVVSNVFCIFRLRPYIPTSYKLQTLNQMKPKGESTTSLPPPSTLLSNPN